MAGILVITGVHEIKNWAVFKDKDGWTVCACGAHWSLKPGSVYEDMMSLFNSHVLYAEHKLMETQ